MFKVVYITGFAGTGKSTTLVNLIKEYKTALVLTPTHKAKGVLENKFKDLNLKTDTTFRTIHSLLRAVPKINEEARSVDKLNQLVKTTVTKLKGATKMLLAEQEAIFIDEAGMIDVDLFTTALILFQQLQLNVPIYVFLDPYQLTPVKAKQIEIPKTKIDVTDNTKIIQQIINSKDNTRFNLITQYRSNKEITHYYTKVLAQIQKSIGEEPILDLSKPSNLVLTPPRNLTITKQEAIKMFNKDTDIHLAYTNATVASFLDDIKEKYNITDIVNANLPLQLGNSLVLSHNNKLEKEPFILEDEALYNQRGVIDPRFRNYQLDIVRNSKTLTTIKASIEHPAFGDISGYFIVMPNYYKWLKLCKQLDQYLVTKNKQGWARGDDKREFLAKKYYPVKNAYPLDLALSLTVHKAQGSEYKRVFINYEDLKTLYSINRQQFFRLLYVASSRAIDNLYFIR